MQTTATPTVSWTRETPLWVRKAAAEDLLPELGPLLDVPLGEGKPDKDEPGGVITNTSPVESEATQARPTLSKAIPTGL